MPWTPKPVNTELQSKIKSNRINEIKFHFTLRLLYGFPKNKAIALFSYLSEL
jgi:hypothetical protein